MRERLQRFLRHLGDQGLSPQTIRGYRHDLESFVVWLEAAAGRPVAAAELGSLDVAEYRWWLMQRGRKPATVRRARAALSRFGRWLAEGGVLAENPVPPGGWEGGPAARHLTPAEEERLLEVVRLAGSRDRAILLLLRAGLTSGELVRLQNGDLELTEEGGWLRVVGRGGRERRVPCDAETARALREHLRERRAGGGWLFPGRGGPLGMRRVGQVVAECAARAGLEGISPFTLRHTRAVRLLAAGESPLEVARILGTSPAGCLRYWTKGDGEDAKADLG
ncbi:MAG: tyrosine-type recombinase/integrase [Thermaerobacter sp.]|nr:tyrosine-type recombinase/integrase [Thermaerobacter sp.]